MRTTLDLPEDLVEAARKAVGYASTRDTIVIALRELVHRRGVSELKSMLGSVEINVDVPRSRRRTTCDG